MCVLRDTYLIDDPAYREIYEEDTKMQSQGVQSQVDKQEQEQEKAQNHIHANSDHQHDKPHLALIIEQVEEISIATETIVEHVAIQTRPVVGRTVTAYYWCRVCQHKIPANEAKSCDCGVTMCNVCWQEWGVTCPICESDMT